jgi:hypothetical protein
MNTLEVIPNPIALLESMRAVGYTPESAVADIIDNSISAGARVIEVNWDPSENPYVAILDDGIGMDSDELTNAMRLGSTNPNEERKLADLGRFGLGLKTASMSQCRRLTVISKKDQKISIRRWDMDLVAKLNKWIIEIPKLEDIKQDRLVEKLKKQENGTVVIWENLDKLISGAKDTVSEITTKFKPLEDHLALVFHRYLKPENFDEKILITLNDKNIPALDPFLKNNHLRQKLEGQTITHELGVISVTPYILPPVSHMSNDDIFTAGGAEGLRTSQGFYIYRNKRLVIWGTWFRLVNKDEFFKLARIQVDVPNSFDSLWALDIKKSTAFPPEIIRKGLKDLIPYFISNSRSTIVYSGRKQLNSKNSPLWIRIEKYGKARYVPNIDHPVIQAITEKLENKSINSIEKLFNLLSTGLPMQAIYADMTTDSYLANSQLDIEEIVQTIKEIKIVTGIEYEKILKMEPFINYHSIHKKIINQINDE